MPNTSENVLTAPLALIKIKGVTVGKIKNIRLQEQFQRGDVRGLGALLSSEVPILSIQCTFNCDSYVISPKKLGTIDNPFVMRGVSVKDQFVNTLLLQESGVDIYIMKKGAKTILNGVVTDIEDINFFVVKDSYMDSQSFDIQESQISGSSLSGRYLTPVMSAS